MTRTAFIFHGSNGYPERHWFPWIKKKLEQKGLEVIVPRFPIDKKTQLLNNWMEVLKPYQNKLNESILIGHSLGVPFIFNILNDIDCKIQAAFLVAGFIGPLEAKDEPNLNDFSVKDFNWNIIKSKCLQFCVFHSDNDPYVPLERANQLADKLGVSVTLIKGAGHFQAEGGYKEFDRLFQEIEKVL
ncbi:MAG: alpha/beta hydrolase [Nanoarchaeota archaeon]|nr:alpha/beta hydrolase [Nanoarchaeota archaeon]